VVDLACGVRGSISTPFVYHVNDCHVWDILNRVDLHKVDELVDDSAGDKVERTFPGLGEVVGDQGVDSDAQVVLHEHFLR
jgi:hypothetical protein